MTTYRFRDGLGQTVDEREFAEHPEALEWAASQDEFDEDIQRVEFLGPEGDWRWAGPLLG